MPFIKNLTGHLLNLNRIGAELAAGAEREVTRAEAALLRGHPLLSISDKAEAKPPTKKAPTKKAPTKAAASATDSTPTQKDGEQK